MKRFLILALVLITFQDANSQEKLTGAKRTDWKSNLLNYINTKLAKPDGGYGWEDQYDSHLTPTYAVTGILYNVNSLPANKGKLAEFIRTHHPQKGRDKSVNYVAGNAVVTEAGPSGSNLRNFVYEQLKAIPWLGGDLTYFRDDIKSWKSQAGILANYEVNNYAGLYQEAMTPICAALAGVEMQDKNAFIKYLQSCRRENGSFNNSPASAGGDGNMLNTHWALLAEKSLSLRPSEVAETANWINSCQLKNGGFTHQPNPEIGKNDDVIYTWAAIKSLSYLNQPLKNKTAVIQYLSSLLNADGGFGDRPGLHSTPVASFYAIDALKELNALDELSKVNPKTISKKSENFSGSKIYTVQFQAHGQGSPQEAVALADSLKINLWGVKYPVDGWLEAAQRIADDWAVPVKFFYANEPHDNTLIVPGMGSFNHVLDYLVPASAAIHFPDSATFQELNEATLNKLKQVNGGLMLQVSNNEPLARILLDESVNNFGYLAVSTVHFGQNFMFWLPYLAEYRYRLPMVTLQDAHGKEAWWWADELTNHRTLFIAKEPTYDAMISALKNNQVVGVRHDSVSNYRTRMLGGTDATRAFIAKNEKSWKWWDAPEKLIRPNAIIAVVYPGEKYEVGVPSSGINFRIRTKWNSQRETLRSPAFELVELTVNGKPVKTEYKTVKGRGDNFSDAYYLYNLENPKDGTYRVLATIRNVKTGETEKYERLVKYER